MCYIGVMILEGKGQFCGKHVPDKPNTPNNWKLDWSIQQQMTGADVRDRF